MILQNVTLKGEQVTLLLEEGKIKEIANKSVQIDDKIIDCTGLLVIPGLIDVHTHGREGMDTMDADFAPLADAYAKMGTTSVLLTTMTLGNEALGRVTHSDAPSKGAHVLGIHLEGPYISAEKLGAQNGDFVRPPSLEEFLAFGDTVKMITVAPEVEGMTDFIRKASAHAVVSIGHTCCTYDQAIEAIDAGASCLTHTFNAMPPFHHRAPGPIGAGCEKGIYAQLIGDGFHLSRGALVSAYRMFGAERAVLISDSVAPAGLRDGVYSSGDLPVEVREGKIYLEGSDTIAGSYATLLDCVRCAASFGIPFSDAVRMASLTPATMLGIADHKGCVAEGYDADLLLLDRDYHLKMVIIDGEVYANYI